MWTGSPHPGGTARARAVVAAFLPLAAHHVTTPRGPGAPLRVQCYQDRHVWLPAEQSLRSARTGFSMVFCRYCAASESLAHPRPQPTFGQVGVPVRL